MGIVKMEILEKLKKKEGYRVHSFQRSEFFSSKRRGGGGEREREEWTRRIRRSLGSYAGSCRCVNARTSSNAAPE